MKPPVKSTVTFNLTVDRKMWNDWKSMLPRGRSLNSYLVGLILEDIGDRKFPAKGDSI